MIDPDTAPLNELRPGEAGVIVTLRGGREFQHRVISMGLVAGTEIEMIRNHRPGHRGGGPVVVRSGETRLMLGHGTSEHILVRRRSTA